MTPEIIDRIVRKLTSGQWMLAVSGAFVFAYCAVNGILNNETVGTLLGGIFGYYFARNRTTAQ